MPAERTKRNPYPPIPEPQDVFGQYETEKSRDAISAPGSSTDRFKVHPPTQWGYPPLPPNSIAGPPVPSSSSMNSPTAIPSPALSQQHWYYDQPHTPLPFPTTNNFEVPSTGLHIWDTSARAREEQAGWTNPITQSSRNATLDSSVPLVPRDYKVSHHQQIRRHNFNNDVMSDLDPRLSDIRGVRASHLRPELPPDDPSHDIGQVRDASGGQRETAALLSPTACSRPSVVSPTQDPFLNPFKMLEFKMLEETNFLDIDKPAQKESNSDSGKFFMCSNSEKQTITDRLAERFDDFCRSNTAMQPFSRYLIRVEAAILGRAVFHSKEAALHILTTSENLIMCPYHADIVKDYKTERVSNPRVRPDPEAPRGFGFLHCGCPEDEVILEMMLRKITCFRSPDTGKPETMRTDHLNPLGRAFLYAVFRRWTGLSADDLFRFTGEGKARTYEDVLRSQIKELEMKLKFIEVSRQGA